jgi:hypothetical protein
MVTPGELRSDIDNILRNGEVVRFRFLTGSQAADGFDDDVVWVQSGADVFTSGLVQPLDTSRGSKEANLLEQGLLTTNDLKCYVQGTVETSGLFKLGIGSPNYVDMFQAEAGVQVWGVGGENVYKKVYLTELTTGSFIGE